MSGDLKELIKTGCCNILICRDLELYRYVDARIQTGSKKMEAVLDAEIQFKVCEKTVYNILNTFK